MKKINYIWLGGSLLLALIVLAGIYPSPAKADVSGITETPTEPVEVTVTPTEPVQATATPTGQPPEPPLSTATPTATNTEPPESTSPPSRPRPTNTPAPLLPETGETPIDPFQASSLVIIAALGLLGLALGVVIGRRLGGNNRRKE